jgi:hypothetical protein
MLLSLLLACETPMAQRGEKKPIDEGKVAVSIQVGDLDVTRTVFPQVALTDVDHYALWGALVGDSETVLIPSFTAQNASAELAAGIWNFTVKGYNRESRLILEGKLGNKTISNDSNSLAFSIAPLREGDGSIAITIILPSGSGITTAAVFKDGTALPSSSGSVTGNQVTYNATSVPAGDYGYVFYLKDSAAHTLAVVPEVVQVRAYLTSAKTITLTDINPPPPSITITLASQTDVDMPSQSVVIQQGESRSFAVTGTYKSYQWYRDAVPIPGETGASYTLNTTSMSLGTYTLSVIVVSNVGERFSGMCSVRVVAPGTPITGSWVEVANSPFAGGSIDAITYGNNKFVAGGMGYDDNGYSVPIMAHSSDGVNWTAVAGFPFDGVVQILAITHSNDKFFASGVSPGYHGKIAYSSDGINWIASDTPFGFIGYITYGNDQFVAGCFGGEIAYSSDRITWTAGRRRLLFMRL